MSFSLFDSDDVWGSIGMPVRVASASEQLRLCAWHMVFRSYLPGLRTHSAR